MVQEKKQKIDFQDGRHAGHLETLIGTILTIFDLQVTPMLPTKFQVNWPLDSEEEAKNRISRWPPQWLSWILDRNDFYLFLIYKTPRCFLPCFESIGRLFQKKQKVDFQDGRHGSHLGFPIGTITAIFDLQATQMLPTKFQVNWPFGSGGEAKK